VRKNSTTRLRDGRLAARTADLLREAILEGRYAIGQPLREAELCETLGVSRIPVREALRRLEGEGLVELRPNRGAVVAGLSEDEIHEVAEACVVLEAHLLTLALPAVTPELVRGAALVVDELDRVTQPREWSRLNWRFHTLLYEAARRPLLVDWLAGLRARAERAMLLLIADQERQRQLNLEHRFILECVRAGRADEAVASLQDHLKGGRDRVLRLIETS